MTMEYAPFMTLPAMPPRRRRMGRKESDERYRGGTGDGSSQRDQLDHPQSMTVLKGRGIFEAERAPEVQRGGVGAAK